MGLMIEKTKELCKNVQHLQDEASQTLIICSNADKEASGQKNAKAITQKSYEKKKNFQTQKLHNKEAKAKQKR